MPTSLQRIAEKSALRNEHRFQNLMNELTPDYLAWCRTQLNKKAAPGADRVTVREYGKNLSENVTDLWARLKKGGYRARLTVRRFYTKGRRETTPTWSSSHRR